jgi:hypothetical protein
MLNASINDAFKVSNNPAIVGWHVGMVTHKILDQLSQIYGQPTPAAFQLNDVVFCSQYSAADAPKVLFRCIKMCTEIAILGNNPYTDCQLINNAICLLLTTGLYIRPFKEWDRLLPVAQTWIDLHRLIQEAFQCRLNATAPTVGHHGYAPAQPYLQNAFGILSKAESDNEESIANTVATQVAALTYQSQCTQSTAANTSQCHDMQLAQLAANQEAHLATMHQLIDSLNAVVFNISDAGRGIRRFGGGGSGYAGRGRGGRSRMQGLGRGPPNYIGGYPQGGFPPTVGRPIGTHSSRRFPKLRCRRRSPILSSCSHCDEWATRPILWICASPWPPHQLSKFARSTILQCGEALFQLECVLLVQF